MLKIGLLWFDTRATEAAVRAAAAHYFAKYGVAADVCHVSMVDYAEISGAHEIDGIEIVASQYALPDHYWIGQRDAAEMPERVDDPAQ